MSYSEFKSLEEVLKEFLPFEYSPRPGDPPLQEMAMMYFCVRINEIDKLLNALVEDVIKLKELTNVNK